MCTTQHNAISCDPARLSYAQLLEENARLRQSLAATEQLLQQSRRQIDELTQLVEKLQWESKRQAAPFRKPEGSAKKPKKPGRKRGKRHGRHAHRSVPPRTRRNV